MEIHFNEINWSNIISGLFIFLFITSGLIQIAPIKINPWSWIAKTIGKALNQNVREDISELRSEMSEQKIKLNSLCEDIDEQNIRTVRTRILQFSDNLYAGLGNYSKEHFDTILDDITLYDNYCAEHPDFKNHRTIQAKKFIDEAYAELLKTHGFLGPNEKDDD